ncbi:hypothetical protein DPMN_074498 [Dreissena polymorpha]|uniref:Uncharacterized protein n=1 Tax=Dreissena polymorpha TaxID=45954 RepID=A0A9D4BE38_DREPO|nr:hypothetical protein DPMN_074498 [Dreissena polymorpha]
MDRTILEVHFAAYRGTLNYFHGRACPPPSECRLVLFCKEDFILGESKGYMDRQLSRRIFSNNKLFLV